MYFRIIYSTFARHKRLLDYNKQKMDCLNERHINKIAAYVKGGFDTPDYYRIHQYLEAIDDIKVTYHLMLPRKLYQKYVPIRKNGYLVVMILFLLVYLRTVWALLNDTIFPPDFLIINRRIMPRKALFPVWTLIRIIRKRQKTRIIWDFDDDIVSMGECSAEDFQFMSLFSHHIIVTHKHLASLVDKKFENKVHILPTTDGDLFKLFLNQEINVHRKALLKHDVILVWLATSANLPFLESVINQLDETAQVINDKLQKRLILKVVCNAPLIHECKNLVVENIRWSKTSAIESLKHAHIGIMPLKNTEIARGKGGFKLVQYMSIGLPCIGTDVGFNNSVINVTFGRLVPADNLTRWTEAILELSDECHWDEYSRNAYKTWENNFPFEKNLLFWKNLLLKKQ